MQLVGMLKVPLEVDGRLETPQLHVVLAGVIKAGVNCTVVLAFTVMGAGHVVLKPQLAEVRAMPEPLMGTT